MCYSIQIERSLKKVAKIFNAKVAEDDFWRFLEKNSSQPKFFKRPGEDNKIFPDYFAPVIIKREGQRILTPMRYQLLPQFSSGPTYSTKNPKTGRNKKISTFNARLDSLEIRKAWSGNFMNRHCIIPFRNFFEWVEYQGGKKEIAFSSQKYPLMWAAGIYDNWKDSKEDLSIDSFAIITTEPRPEVLEMGHDRCPLFMKSQLIDQWLEPKNLTKPQAYALLNQQEEDIFKHKWV